MTFFRWLLDEWWKWKRQRAEETLAEAYRRRAPKGSPPSADPSINAYYARLREKPPEPTPAQRAALKVQQATLARAGDPPRKPDYVDEHGMGHFDAPTVRVSGMLPDMGTPYDDMTPAERLEHQRLRDPDYKEKK